MNELKAIAAALAVTCIAGCATSKPIQGPNGTTAYFVKCGSAVIDKCYEEAARVCPAGYAFLDKDQNGNTLIVPNAIGAVAVRGPISMLVQCK